MRHVPTFLGGLFFAIAMLSAEEDGRWDKRFGSVIEGGVSYNPGEQPQIALFRGNLYRSGETITRWDGAEWRGIGRVDGRAWHLSASATHLYVAGTFASIDGVKARNVASWDGTNWTAMQPENVRALGGRITAVALSPAGELSISAQPADYQQTPSSTIWKWTAHKWERVGDEIRIGNTCKVERIAAGRSNVFAVVYYESPKAKHGYGEYLVEFVKGRWRLFADQPVHYGIHCIAIGDDDRPIVGGEFYTNPSLTNLARWNGQKWVTIGGGLKGYPLILAVTGNELIVGGNFSGAGDVVSRGMVRWDGRKWQGFADGLSGGGTAYDMGREKCVPHDLTSIDSVALDGQRMYASGNFTRAGNSGATGIALWDGNSWQSLNGASHQGVNGRIKSLAAIGTNLFALGDFTGAGGVAVNGIAEWNGERWQTLNAPFRVDFRCAATTDGTNLFVTSAAPDAHLFEWDFKTWKQHGSTHTDWATGLAVRKGKMFVGGYGIHQISNSTLGDLPSSTQMRSGSVDAIAFGTNEIVYAGGNFQIRSQRPWRSRRKFSDEDGRMGVHEGLASRENYNFAVWDGQEWSGAAGGLGRYPDRVDVIVPRGSNVFVGGNFADAGTQKVYGLARWDGSQWHNVGGGVRGERNDGVRVRAIAFHGDHMFIGGRFTQAGNIGANNIAKWDGKQWSALGSGINGQVNALAIIGNRLYAAGEFSTAGTAPSSNLACWELE